MAEELKERRGSPRITSRTLVEVKLPSWQALKSVYTINLSLGGIRLSLGSAPPLDTPIDIIMTLPNGTRLHLPGRVANLGPEGRGDVGIKFNPIPAGVSAEIDRYISEIQAGRQPSSTPMSGRIPSGILIKKT
jgi:hypothetical protein